MQETARRSLEISLLWSSRDVNEPTRHRQVEREATRSTLGAVQVSDDLKPTRALHKDFLPYKLYQDIPSHSCVVEDPSLTYVGSCDDGT